MRNRIWISIPPWTVVLILLGGCSTMQKDYLFKPTTLERGLSPKVILDNVPTPHIKAEGIPLTDVDIVTFWNDVRQSWMKREQFAGGLVMGGAIATEGITAISGLADMSSRFLLPIVALGKWIGSALGSAGTAEREAAYKGGLRLLSDAWSEYVDTLGYDPDTCDPADCIAETRISGTVLTTGAKVLNRRIEAAWVVTDDALFNRVPRLRNLDDATAVLPKPVGP